MPGVSRRLAAACVAWVLLALPAGSLMAQSPPSGAALWPDTVRVGDPFELVAPSPKWIEWTKSSPRCFEAKAAPTPWAIWVPMTDDQLG